MRPADMLLRDVEVDGRAGLDVRIHAGKIAEIGARLPARGLELDGAGGALIPGLCDHHIHLLGLAAQAQSIDLRGVTGAARFAARITEALAQRPAGAWVRVINYHETMAGDLTRHDLDALAPGHRLRVQHQTGSLWILNSAGLAAVSGDDHPGVERDVHGHANGRVWRADAWLRTRIDAGPPPLAPIGQRLAACGVTALTDASVTTGAEAAGLLAEAHRRGALPQRLTLMSGGWLEPPEDPAFTVGPVKVLLDDHDLPDLDDFTARIRLARDWGRAVAVHCVTAGELALTLAAFETAGARPGDRIEHGGVIPQAAIPQLKTLGLTVITQPGFIRERGDRYAAQTSAQDQDDLYRCASLREAGVVVAASSDAPYASPDPWLATAAATDRRSHGGRILGAAERVTPATALSMWLGDPAWPGRVRRVAVGEAADLCLLKAPLRVALATPGADMVAATLIGGEIAFAAA